MPPADDSLRAMLAHRLEMVEQRIEQACRRVGRSRDEVTLVAVTKTVGTATAALAPDLGCLDLGESRPQELWAKAAVLPSNVRWHLIGHLQRNKIEQTLPLVHLLHSVDSARLLAALEQECAKQRVSLDVLIEVNASRETSKHGFAPDALGSLAATVTALRHIRVRGLMTMAAPENDPEHCRPTFVELRRLRDRLRGEWPEAHDLRHLSMGMSNDFEIAVEEGATLVRLGTVLFEEMA